jgi:hypothetical protein
LCAAAHNLEGSFASEGLVAMAGEDANVEIALARSLVECLDEGDARWHWNKLINQQEDLEDRQPFYGMPADRGNNGQLWLEGFGPEREVLPFHQPRRQNRPARRPRVSCANSLF